MTTDRIKDLANKGFITQIAEIEALAKLNENDLVDKGYITQTNIFDGLEDTLEESIIDEPVVDD